MGATSSTDAENDEALFYAAAHGDDALVAELLERAANVNHIQRDQDFSTPCVVAAQEGNSGCLKLLLAHHTCECDRADQYGFTPCAMAAKWGHLDCLQLLLASGANPTLRTKDGATTCHLAAEYDRIDCLRALVAAGVSVEEPHRGRTPYEVAVEQASEACIEFLEHHEQQSRRTAAPGGVEESV